MPSLWSFKQTIDWGFHEVAATLFRKYPNEYSTHVVSVDILDRSIDPETGVLRTERLIGVKQPAPRWVSTLLGTTDASYAREVTFVIPATSGADDTLPPQILVSSINMSLKNVLTCYERISYTASSKSPNSLTDMHTLAEISVQGKLRNGGMAARKVGKKMEEWSLDKYVDNSSIGRAGLDSVLEKYFPQRQATN